MWYSAVAQNAMHIVNPIYHKQLKERVLNAILEWEQARIREGLSADEVTDELVAFLQIAVWPNFVKDYIEAFIDGTSAKRKEMRLQVRKHRNTRPPYAPILDAGAGEFVPAAVAAAAAPVPAPVPAPVLSPIRSRSPVVHELNVSASMDNMQLPPPDATREEILAWIHDASHGGDGDPITMDAWDEMTLEQLRRTVRTQEGRVYTAESLEGMIRAAMEAEKPARNAYSRKPLTRKNFRALRDVMRRENPAYALPTRTQQRPPKHMGLAFTEEGEFFHVWLIDVRTRAIGLDLGYIPATVESVEAGSADYTSASLVAALQTAWDSGKFLTSYRSPFTCCRFHLGKNKAWWTSPGSTKVDRLRAMIDEIRSVM